jgi:hypothetical protein
MDPNLNEGGGERDFSDVRRKNGLRNMEPLFTGFSEEESESQASGSTVGLSRLGEPLPTVERAKRLSRLIQQRQHTQLQFSLIVVSRRCLSLRKCYESIQNIILRLHALPILYVPAEYFNGLIIMGIIEFCSYFDLFELRGKTPSS